MKKIGVLFFFFAFCCALPRLVAQDDLVDDSQAPQPMLLFSTGLGMQLLEPFFKTSYFCLEKPLGPYLQVGLSATVILRNYNVYNYDIGLGKDSYEGALLFKRFFRGRLSARRSPFYIGADLRGGKRTYFENQDFFGGKPLYQEISCTSFKLMALSGVQYRLGAALLEFSLPVGLEWVVSKSSPSDQFGSYYLNNALGRSIVLLPSIGLGYTLQRHDQTRKKHHKR